MRHAGSGLGGSTTAQSVAGSVASADKTGFAIEANGLAKRFDRVAAVESADLRVPRGAIVGLLGPNGAGKTTLIRMLLGLVLPDRGSVWLLGAAQRPGQPAPSTVGALVERPALYPYLSAEGNLVNFAVMGGLLNPVAHAIEALELVGLGGDATRLVRGFSTGMRQRLAIALCLLGHPALLILDEPVNGLDPEGIVDIRDMLRRMRDAGVTTLLSSHLLSEVELVCDRVAVMNRGRIVAEGELPILLGGAHLVVGFGSASDLARATSMLSDHGVTTAAAGELRLRVDASVSDGIGMSATLAGSGIYPTELIRETSSLESRYMELIGASVPSLSAPSPTEP